MKRKSIGARHEMIVQPTFIIGTFNQDGTPDFAPITWVSKTCEEGDTCLIVISMYGTKRTKQNVLRTGQLTVNLATTGMLPLVDYFGQTSGKEGLKAALPYAWGRALRVEAPTLDESPWVCECQVASQVATIQEQEQTIQVQAETIQALEAAGTAAQVEEKLEAAYQEGVESNG